MNGLISSSFKKKFPPPTINIVYILFSVTFCFLYYLKVVKAADFFRSDGLNTVMAFEAAKPFQFRLLVPYIFKLIYLVNFIPQKALFMAYCCVIVYFILLAYYYLISEYFEDKFTNYQLALFILYPMTWNYILLNDTMHFYDFTAILLFTIGLYFILKGNFKILLIVFFIGLINKETIAYLIFAYAFFNYKYIFTKKIILNVSILVLIFIAVKIILYFMFRTNPGDPIEICLFRNIEIVSIITTNQIYAKNVFLNFGGLYFFIILLFVSGRWKRYASDSNKSKLFINLAIVPFLIFGIFIIYISEVRVYTEMMPIVSTLFLIYLSTCIKLPNNNRCN